MAMLLLACRFLYPGAMARLRQSARQVQVVLMVGKWVDLGLVLEVDWVEFLLVVVVMEVLEVLQRQLPGSHTV